MTFLWLESLVVFRELPFLNLKSFVVGRFDKSSCGELIVKVLMTVPILTSPVHVFYVF